MVYSSSDYFPEHVIGISDYLVLVWVLSATVPRLIESDPRPYSVYVVLVAQLYITLCDPMN